MNKNSKPQLEVLNGLRGFVAIMVLVYHLFEGFAFAWGREQGLAHGHLGVDFFFMLSGFVLAYAYDERWSYGLTSWSFIQRRFRRLHPMILIGALLGVVAFLIQGSQQWDGTSVPWVAVALAFLLQLLMLPALPGSVAEVRGNGEMFPLNGPSWSLFFEYIASFGYAFVLRRLSKKALLTVALLLGIGSAYFSISGGGMAVGWSLLDNNFVGGLLRVFFPFTIGMLIARNYQPLKIEGGFWKCALALLLLFSIPQLGSGDTLWLNGLYDFLVIALIFPFLIFVGASDVSQASQENRAYRFLGQISYPVYIIHYPFYYLFYYWLMQQREVRLDLMVTICVGLVLGMILLAYLFMRYYDTPVRRSLSKRSTTR